MAPPTNEGWAKGTSPLPAPVLAVWNNWVVSALRQDKKLPGLVGDCCHSKPRDAPGPTFCKSSKAPPPWPQGQCHLENTVDSKLSCCSHGENQDPSAECPSGGTAHLPGRNVAVTMGQLCVPPRFQASRARAMPTSRVWRCACQALGAGSHPASPGSSHSPRPQHPRENATRACRRPGRPSGESGKAEDKFKAPCEHIIPA